MISRFYFRLVSITLILLYCLQLLPLHKLSLIFTPPLQL
jgi:hypothetical protein